MFANRTTVLLTKMVANFNVSIALVAFLGINESVAFTFSTSTITNKNAFLELHAKESKKSIEDTRLEREREILEIGGDLFFLEDDSEMKEDVVDKAALLNEEEQKVHEEEPDFLWDGEVDESAYFDLE